MRMCAIATIGLLVIASNASPQPVAGEKLFATTTHDFGIVPRAQVLHKFVWTNTEKVRLEVTDIRVTCGCATATPTPKVVEPGKSGEIEVLVDAKKFVGQKDVQVHLTLAGETKQVATLRVSIHCRPDIVYNPGEVSFGIVPLGTAASQAIEIEYAGKLDWRIEELVNVSPHLEAVLQEMYRKPGEIGYRIKVQLKPGVPVGDFKHELQLRTNDPGAKVIPVLVQGTIRGRLTATPATLDFGAAKLGQTVTRRVVLRGDKPFLITEVEGLPADVKVAKGSRPTVVQTLTFSWTPSASGELAAAQILVRTDLDEKAVVTLPVQGSAGQ